MATSKRDVYAGPDLPLEEGRTGEGVCAARPGAAEQCAVVREEGGEQTSPEAHAQVVDDLHLETAFHEQREAPLLVRVVLVVRFEPARPHGPANHRAQPLRARNAKLQQT